VCPTHAIHFIRPQPQGQDAPVDLTKRGFMVTLGATAAALPLLRLNTVRSRQKNRMTILRPPGARPEDEFLARCVRCGECMRVCPTRALQPAALEAGLEGLWAPQLVPRIGYCVYNCNLCGQVCPSQAIQKLTLDEKHARAMGKAKFSRSRCIPWRGHARFREGLGEWKDCNCGTCEEACPVPGKAIHYHRFVGKVGDEEVIIDRPYVVEDLCIGCGFCENVCPVAGDAAVRVEGPAGTAVLDKEAPESVAVQLDDWSIEGWKLTGKPKAYVGGKQLYEYINGAGEPYLPYGFVQVTVAHYQRGEEKLKVDLWQFKTSEGAFGAYSRDASNAATHKVLGPLPFASAGEGETWLCTGTHYLHVTDPDYQLPSDDLLEATRAIHSRIPKAASSLPAVVAALPKKSQVGVSIHYFHHPLTVPEHAATPGKLLGTKGLATTVETPAAFALYGTLDKPTHGALIVDYATEADAATARDRATQVLASMGATIRTVGALTIAEREGNANVLVHKGTRLGAILRAKDTAAAVAAGRELLAGLE
ncbi:4Fe-4S dicluster domain-containing protein, partial [bacterium]|nr:4Fe-4S dicluster domain-containing protein [bacterium]